jgi:hypothetical protein
MVTKNRLEAFSDGVFAIVITLLVIEIHPPELHGDDTLARGLWEQWPNYLGYLLSFVILGVMWLNHHRIFEPVRRVDGLLLVLNLNLLLAPGSWRSCHRGPWCAGRGSASAWEWACTPSPSLSHGSRRRWPSAPTG